MKIIRENAESMHQSTWNEVNNQRDLFYYFILFYLILFYDLFLLLAGEAWLLIEVYPPAEGNPQMGGKTQDQNLPLVFLLGSGEDPANALTSGAWFLSCLVFPTLTHFPSPDFFPYFLGFQLSAEGNSLYLPTKTSTTFHAE